jgi:hypothetical protein
MLQRRVNTARALRPSGFDSASRVPCPHGRVAPRHKNLCDGSSSRLALRARPDRSLGALAACLLAALLGRADRAAAADPTTADCLVANDRSIALRNQHQLRAARAELLVCAAPSCPADVRSECVRRVAEVNAQMPTVVFEVRDSEGNDLSAVTVTMDGQPLAPRIEGTALSIDPGAHEFVFTAPDFPAVHKHWIIREAEKGRRERVTMGAPVPARPPEVRPAEAPPGPLVPEPARPAPPEAAAAKPSGGLGAQRVVGIVVGGLGAVGLGVALLEQITANSRYSHSQKAATSMDIAVRETTHPLYQQARRAQNYAIMFAAAGTLAVGAGLVLLFVAADESEPSADSVARQSIVPTLAPGGGGLVYSSTF